MKELSSLGFFGLLGLFVAPLLVAVGIVQLLADPYLLLVAVTATGMLLAGANIGSRNGSRQR